MPLLQGGGAGATPRHILSLLQQVVAQGTPRLHKAGVRGCQPRNFFPLLRRHGAAADEYNGTEGRQTMQRHRRLCTAAGLIGVLAALLGLAGCGPSAGGSGAGAAVTPITTVAPAPGGPYPTPQEETFRGCPPQGDGGDSALNLLKNRIDSAAWQPASLPSLLALTWPPGVERIRRANWSSADTATVQQDEGRPVVTEGYVLMIRHEGPESPNCHVQTQRDYHVWLAASPAQSRANSMIVELAPRVVALNPGWGSEANILRLAGHHVRVSGWLLLDQEHPEQLHQTRGTLWEIHPAMKIEVDQNGAWSDLAAGGITLARLPSGSGSTARSSAHSGGSSSHRSRHRSHKRRRRR